MTYDEQIADVRERMEGKTLDELEKRPGVGSVYNYIGVGFGYRLKTNHPKTREEAEKAIKQPLFDEVLKLAEQNK
jgi:hypothetical protein